MAKVIILEGVCKSCGYCVKTCPKNVLEITGKKVNKYDYKVVEVARPDDCISCGMCATICPDAAIEVYK